MTCKWYLVCPIRDLYKKGKISKEYIKKYCKSKDNYKNCKRYKLEEKSIAHSNYLLPDGSYLK